MEDDERREAAIASAAAAVSLNPNSSSLSQTRLSKFQELHKRRLQIKEKSSKIKKKSKGRSFGQSSNSNAEDCASEISCKSNEEDISSNSVSLDTHQQMVPSVPKQVVPQIAPKKPQKLHWGLDTKERWERKSNM
ncbi:uncharacterized protein [Rutidosis leptorrhynchoides]|uniref:uncharacterized protein isoform X2 n=1 Tax=Rutidosis leptorrhynchoides TaxID=125765 RepID=UPI003A992831